MKLHADSHSGQNTVTGYGADWIEINRERHAAGLVVMPDRILAPWGGAGLATLGERDFAAIRDLAPDVVLLGTGLQQRFPPPHLFRPLMEARIGIEVMDLQAACRTYNILMAEGRRVAAALLFF